MKNNIEDFSLREELWNKWYNLLLLKNNGFLIPETFVLSICEVNKIFSIKSNKLCIKNKGLLKEIFSFLEKEKKYVFRSSSIYEDSSWATFAGLFESVVSNWRKFLQSIIKVLESYLKEEVFIYAKKKNIDFDRKSFQIAILIQEFIEWEFAGVCNLWEKDEIIEMSRIDNLSITSTWEREIFLYNSKLWKNTLPIDFHPKILDQVTKKFLQAKKIFEDKEVLIEWTYKNNSLVFLQIRELSLHQIQKKQTFFNKKEISWNEFIEITKKLLEELGFSQDEWFLHETGFSLSFRYITKKIQKNTYNRTFTLFLCTNEDDKRLADWISVKNIELTPVLRPKFWCNSYLDSINTFYNIDFTFSVIWKNNKDIFYICDTNIWMYKYSLKVDMNLFSFYNFSTFKKFFDNNIGDYKNILKNILYDRKIIMFLLKNVTQKTFYNENLLLFVSKELWINSKILQYVLSQKNNYKISWISKKVSWEVVSWSWIIEWFIILKSELDWFIFEKHKNYFYVSYDFEPFYMRYIDFLSGMILARWNYLCHWVAVCKEFWLPIICSTKNIHLLKTWDYVRINFSNGEVILL